MSIDHEPLTQPLGEDPHMQVFAPAAPLGPEQAVPETTSNHHARNALIILGAVTLVGGAVVVGVEATQGGGDSKGSSAHPNPGQAANPAQQPKGNQLTPTSIPTPAELGAHATPVDLQTVVPDTDVLLGINQGGPVPECIADPTRDPAATFNAFLADFSFYLGTGSENDAGVAQRALTQDSEAASELEGARMLWQQKHAGQALWFWGNPKVHFRDSGDSVEVIAEGPIYYAAVPSNPNGSWGDMAPKDPPKDAAMINGLTLTYQAWNGHADAGNRTSLVGSQIPGMDNADQKLVLPIVG